MVSKLLAGALFRWGGTLPLIGVNLVPLGGVFLAGWSASTALSLYWWENLVGSLLVALRIALHRHLTGKRGHRRLQLGLQGQGELRVAGKARRRWELDRERKQAQRGSFLVEFLVAAGAASVLHGALLWVVLRLLLATGPEAAQLRLGVLVVAAFQLLGFGIDLVGLRERPFAWIRDLAQATAARVTLIHVAIVVGFWVGVGRAGLSGFFGPFVVLKAMADVGNALAWAGVRADPEEAPRWLAATMNRLRPAGGDFAAHWREDHERRRRLCAEDEEVAR